MTYVECLEKRIAELEKQERDAEEAFARGLVAGLREAAALLHRRGYPLILGDVRCVEAEADNLEEEMRPDGKRRRVAGGWVPREAR